MEENYCLLLFFFILLLPLLWMSNYEWMFVWMQLKGCVTEVIDHRAIYASAGGKKKTSLFRRLPSGVS